MAGRGCGYGDLINVGHFDLSEQGFSAVWGEMRRERAAICGVHSQLGAEWIRMQNVPLRSLAVLFTTCLFYWNESVGELLCYLYMTKWHWSLYPRLVLQILISAVWTIIRFNLPFLLMICINLISPASCSQNQSKAANAAEYSPQLSFSHFLAHVAVADPSIYLFENTNHLWR